MLAALFVPAFIQAILGSGMDLFKAYLNKQITLAELEASITKIAMQSWADVERSHADSIAKTYASFTELARNNPLVQRVWATVVLSQLCVLLWAQLGTPYLVYTYGGVYPSAGATIDWAYALIAGLMGLGAVTLRKTPNVNKPPTKPV